MYVVLLRAKSGGDQYVMATANRQFAAAYCKTRNEAAIKAGSPNRWHFEETPYRPYGTEGGAA